MADSSFRINRGITLNPQTGAPTSPTNGDLYFDSTMATYSFYQNGFWINLASRSDVASATDLTSTQFTAAIVQNSLVRITGSTATNVHGLVASTAAKQVLLYNQTSSTVIIKYASATEATAANRILTPTQGDVTLTSGQTMLLVYDDSQSRWITSSSPGTGGSGSGVGDDLDSLLFKASFQDNFDEGPTSSLTSVNSAAAQTDPTAYNASKAMYTLNYDASKTIAAGTTTTNVNISATAAFTVKTGDVVVVGGQVARITAVATQASFTTTTFPTAPTVGAQVTISQAVHTLDIYNLAVDGNSIAAAFPSAPFTDILVDYEDTTTPGDSIFDINVAPVVGWVATNAGGVFTSTQVRPTLETSTATSTALPSSGTTLVLRFFANQTTGSGSVNLLRYKVFVQKDSTTSAGGTLNSAYAFLNGVGTPVNCSTSVSGGKSLVTLSGFTYAVGVATGTPYGSLDVYLNGQLIPRFINSTLTPDASYLETSSTVLTLDRDYSSQNISVEVIQRVGIVDVSTTNTTSISAIQEQDSNGFQGFVNQSNLMTATTSTGSPVSGTFYSSITGRASIVDLTQDLKVRMGIERLNFNYPTLLQTEIGPTNEQVWGVLNDSFGQVRLVGNWSTQLINTTTNGVVLRASSTTDFMEVTFYGTGLNLLVDYANVAFNISYSVDGGGNVTVTGVSGAPFLHTRNYSVNQVLPIVAGLTLGTHTVRINVSTTDIYGCEILNESASLKINPGISYLAGKKLTATAQTVVSPSTTFDSGTLGTAGGRVVVYQKADGTIGKAVQPTGGQANLASANHANEEALRTYWVREFGAARNDDFSGNLAAGSYAFTLDDGTTTLLGSSVRMGTAATLSEVLQISANGGFITFIFVGTGLDVVRQDDGTGTDTYSYLVDGTSIGNVNTSTSGPKTIEKVVSGLPYGTHTVKLLRTTAANSSRAISRFIVYQPKKPAIPAGAVEIADYNVMANFSANSTANGLNVSTGVLRKSCTREFTYINGTGGTQDWAAEGPQGGTSSGNQMDSTRTNAYFEYTFFGTGFDFRYSADSNRSASITVSLQSLTTGGSLVTLNSTNFPGLTTSSYGGTFTYASGNLSQTAGGTTPGSGMVVSGLTLGTYKVRFNNNTASSFITVESFDVITPIHSTKSNLFADLMNTLPIGSCALSDNRKTTPVKDILPAAKPWVQAFAQTTDPSTTSATAIPMPDMSLTIRTFGNPIEVAYGVEIQNTSTGNNSATYLYVDGVQVGVQKDCNTPTAGARFQTNDNVIVPVSPGLHVVAVYWQAFGGTLSATGSRRSMKAREI